MLIVQSGVKALQGTTIDGQAILIRPNGSADYNTQTSIFVKSIPEGTTLNDFYQSLSQFGTVIQSYVRLTLNLR